MKNSKSFLSLVMLIIFSVAVFDMYKCKNNDKGISKDERQEVAIAAKMVLEELSDEVKAQKSLPDELFKEYKLVKSYFVKLADNNSMSDEELISLLAKVEESSNKINRIASTTDGGLEESCPGGCNGERQSCQSDCRSRGRRICGCFITAVGCGFCCFLCPSSVEHTSITSWFKVGEAIPLELINIPAKDSNSMGRFFYADLKVLGDNSVEITLKNIENYKSEFLKVIYDSNGNARVEGSNDSKTNNFILNNFSKWCGKWHAGVKNYWRLCGGGSCSGEGNRWCIQYRRINN